MPVRFPAITKPAKWPQSKLTVPNGAGSMPRVDVLNKDIEREWFQYSGSILDIGWGETKSVVIPTDADGDFWMTNFYPIAYVGNLPNNAFWGYVKLSDGRSLYELFDPPIQHRALVQLGAPVALAFAGSAKLLTPSIEPYCFTRDGTIRVTYSLLAKAAARVSFNIYFTLIGWKEYNHASK